MHVEEDGLKNDARDAKIVAPRTRHLMANKIPAPNTNAGRTTVAIGACRCVHPRARSAERRTFGVGGVLDGTQLSISCNGPPTINVVTRPYGPAVGTYEARLGAMEASLVNLNFTPTPQ